MDTIDWRTQLQPDSRQRVMDKIMETLKRHVRVSSPEELADLRKIATRFEEKVYMAGTSQSDYLRKISMKMMTVETKSTSKAKTIQSNFAGSAQNPPDPGQSQIPLSNNFEAWQQLLSQNVENAIANTGVQSSANLPSALPSVNPVYYVREYEQFMDCNNWRPIKAEPDMDITDWRTQLQPDSRQRVVNKIMETLNRHLPMSGPEGLVERRNRMAARFENKIFDAATSQLDYLRKISLKMLTIETKVQTTTTMANTLPSNSVVIAQNPPQPAYYVREDEQFMDCNNWRPTQAEPNMDATDWKTH